MIRYSVDRSGRKAKGRISIHFHNANDCKFPCLLCSNIQFLVSEALAVRRMTLTSACGDHEMGGTVNHLSLLLLSWDRVYGTEADCLPLRISNSKPDARGKHS